MSNISLKEYQNNMFDLITNKITNNKNINFDMKESNIRDLNIKNNVTNNSNKYISDYQRFFIYKNSIYQNYSNILLIIYKRSFALMDIYKINKNNIIMDYLSNISSFASCSNIDNFGHDFSDFLKASKVNKIIDFIYDIALLDWYENQSYEAYIDNIITKEYMAHHIDFANIEDYLFYLNNSIKLINSQYNLIEISNLINNTKEAKRCKYHLDNQEKNIKNYFYLIIRHEGEMNIINVNKYIYDFLFNLLNYHDFNLTFSSLENNNAEDKLNDLIEILFKYNMITKIIHKEKIN